MPNIDLRSPCYWLTGLIYIAVLALAPQAWAQPSGMGKGGGMGGLMGGGGMGGGMGEGGGPGEGKAPKGKAQMRFDLNQATTITGQVESVGSYGLAGWRSLPGMTVQGLVLTTDQGNIEVYLGPPSYAAKQKFILQKGDTLEVNGFKVLHGDKPGFYAAKVKKSNQTLNLMDEHGSPLWKQQEAGRPNSERGRRGGNDPSQVGGGMMGAGGLGKGR